MNKTAYLCIVTWPDGTEGLLFPRPGNVPIAVDETAGRRDFMIAVQHLRIFAAAAKEHGEEWKLAGTTIRLVKFQALEVLAEHVHGE